MGRTREEVRPSISSISSSARPPTPLPPPSGISVISNMYSMEHNGLKYPNRNRQLDEILESNK